MMYNHRMKIDGPMVWSLYDHKTVHWTSITYRIIMGQNHIRSDYSATIQTLKTIVLFDIVCHICLAHSLASNNCKFAIAYNQQFSIWEGGCRSKWWQKQILNLWGSIPKLMSICHCMQTTILIQVVTSLFKQQFQTACRTGWGCWVMVLPLDTKYVSSLKQYAKVNQHVLDWWWCPGQISTIETVCQTVWGHWVMGLPLDE